MIRHHKSPVQYSEYFKVFYKKEKYITFFRILNYIIRLYFIKLLIQRNEKHVLVCILCT